MNNRTKYIETVISFMKVETNKFGVTCQTLLDSIYKEFPEINLIFDSPISFFLNNPNIEDIDTLNEYREIVCKEWNCKNLEEQFIINHYNNQSKFESEHFKKMLTFKSVKPQDSIFDQVKYLDPVRVNNILYMTSGDNYDLQTHTNNSLVYVDRRSTIKIHYLIDILKFLNKNAYITVVENMIDNNTTLILYKTSRNNIIMDADREVIKLVDFLNDNLSIEYLLGKLFNVNYKTYEYETLGKLSSLTYSHQAFEMLYELINSTHKNECLLEDIKSLVGLGKASFKNRLLYLVLSKLERPFPDVDGVNQNYAKIGSVYGVHEALIWYCNFKSYPPMDIFDKAVEVFNKRHQSYLKSKQK